jgi:hypothetical protein
VHEGLLAALCLPGFARVQFDIVGMTGYPEVNFPIADYQGVGPFRQYRGVLER